MKKQHTRRGFTLIELLVVILVIGILAAVALPQYKTAVIKSRVAAMLPVLKSIADAQSVYYLANANFAPDIDALDISIPEECALVDYRYQGTMLSCGNNFLIDMNASNEASHVSLNYCPDNNTSWTSCDSSREFSVAFGLASHYALCHAYHNSKLGYSVCSWFSGS